MQLLGVSVCVWGVQWIQSRVVVVVMVVVEHERRWHAEGKERSLRGRDVEGVVERRNNCRGDGSQELVKQRGRWRD